MCSPKNQNNTPNYVHLGADTLKLWKFLENEHNKHVDSVLEIGCGAGFISVWISRFAKKVTSTDINKQALKIMQFNARLNNINNINPIYSDVYSNINQKYDVIISNPPYMFLPIKDKKRIYAYGGHLGLDILTKILIDLDKFLNDNGVAYFLTNSYIMENGTNTLLDLLGNIFYEQDYLITIKEILYQIPSSNSPFYKKEKISKAVLCCIKMEKGKKYKINHIQIRNVSKAIQYLKIKLLRD